MKTLKIETPALPLYEMPLYMAAPAESVWAAGRDAWFRCLTNPTGEMASRYYVNARDLFAWLNANAFGVTRADNVHHFVADSNDKADCLILAIKSAELCGPTTRAPIPDGNPDAMGCLGSLAEQSLKALKQYESEHPV